MTSVDVRWMEPDDVDVVLGSAALFDGLPRPEPTRRFLAEPTHHLALAYVDGRPVGFISGVETTHPDKGTEMFLYELGVDDEFRRRGIGRSLVRALAERAQELGCVGMWVATEPDNESAVATYRSAGATPPAPAVTLDWSFPPHP
jgi:ribosomal protein S18 acetylase RimI-like enzyme